VGHYFCWKSTRRPLVAALRIRTIACPAFSSEQDPLAAASSRSRCVLLEGCPVLSAHFCFGAAPHIGQRTDRICRNESFSGFTPVLFNSSSSADSHSCSVVPAWNSNWPTKGIQQEWTNRLGAGGKLPSLS